MPDRTTQPPKESARAAREKRLAEALRTNLKRRKSAARKGGAGEGAGKVSDTVEKAPKPGGRGG